MRSNRLENQVLSALKSAQLPSKQLVVALSGGADSCALLFSLHRTRKLHGCGLSALHINHLLRGEEAERDALHSEALCKSLGIPFECVRADAAAYAREKKIGTELAGREIRYREMIRAAKERSAAVVTAHTASDNAETVLFNLARGTGLMGLCGIPPTIRKDGVLIVRPLLKCGREEILSYCKTNGISFVQDSSNDLNEYTRNRIRHFVLPALKEAAGFDAEEAVSRMTENLQGDREALEEWTLREFNHLLLRSEPGEIILDGKKLVALSEGAALRVVRLAAEKTAGIVPTRTQCLDVLKIFGKPSAQAPVPKPLAVRTEYDRLIFSTMPQAWTEPFEFPLSFGDNVLPGGGRILLRREEQINRLLTNSRMDYTKIKGILTARSRREGDAIRLEGGTKSLKKLMIEKKIPREKRMSLPVICDETGAVVMVSQLGVDLAFRPDDKSQNVIIIEFEE